MNWFKKLFGIGEKMETDIHGLPYVKSSTPMPKVKPTKGKGISEPVFAMVKAWQKNPKRFKTKINLGSEQFDDFIIHNDRYATLKIIDDVGKEEFIFGLHLEHEALKDIKSIVYHFVPWFATHRVYPVLGCRVNSKPSWMTQDELEFISESVKPYYLKRVNRYRDVVESRLDRTRRTNELKSEIAKQKERNRLMEIYQ